MNWQANIEETEAAIAEQEAYLARMRADWPVVPAHINTVSGLFCGGGGLQTRNGRCQYGCDHEEHYANDGHPECDDE